MSRVAAAAFLSGALFGAGLAIASMTDRQVVLGFLDVAGAWNPTLVFVMGGAVAVTAVAFRLVLKRPRPALGGESRGPFAQHELADLRGRGLIDRALAAGENLEE